MSTRNSPASSRQAYPETPSSYMSSLELHQRKYRRGGIVAGMEDRSEDGFQTEISSRQPSSRESTFKFPNRPVSPTGTLISIRSSASSKASHRSSRSSYSSHSLTSRASSQRSFLSQSIPFENSDDEDDLNFRYARKENFRNFKPQALNVEASQHGFDSVSEAGSAIRSERSYKSFRSGSNASVFDIGSAFPRRGGNSVCSSEGSVYSGFHSRFSASRSTRSSQPDEDCTSKKFNRGMEEPPLSTAFILGLKSDGGKPFNLAERLRRSERSSSSSTTSSTGSKKSKQSRHRKHRYSKGFSDSDSDSTDTASDFDSDSTISSLSSSFSSSGSETETENTPRKRGSSPPVVSKPPPPPPQVVPPSPATTTSSVPSTPSTGRTRPRRVWKDGIPPPPSAATIASWTTSTSPSSPDSDRSKPPTPSPPKPTPPRPVPAYFTTPHYLVQRHRDLSLLRHALLQSHASTDVSLRSQLPEVYEFFIPDQEVWFFAREVAVGRERKVVGLEDCWEAFEKVVRMGMEVEELRGGAREAWREMEGRRKVKWGERK